MLNMNCAIVKECLILRFIWWYFASWSDRRWI